MENLINEKDTQENAIKFLDALSKSLDGLKDKYSSLIFDAQTKNEKIEPILKNWVKNANLIFKSKFEEIYEIKNFTDENFIRNRLKSWSVKYKDNNEFMMNMKVLFKSLQSIRITVKNKICGSDSLSYTSLTDNLINKNKSYK